MPTAAKKTRAARKAPVKKRSEPGATGHSPEQVPVASHIAPGGLERTKDGHAVAAKAGNPTASRAGVIVRHAPPAGPAREDKALGLADVAIETVDGARAVVALGKERTGPLTQSDLVALRKLIDQAIQETY